MLPRLESQPFHSSLACAHRYFQHWSVFLSPPIVPPLTESGNLVLTAISCAGQFIPLGTVDLTTVERARYPLILAQNALSTGLILWRVWRQHRISKTVGLQVANGISLMEVITILLESASLYTLQLVLLNISEFLGHPIRFIARATLVPIAGEPEESILNTRRTLTFRGRKLGMVFNLITIRSYAAERDSRVLAETPPT
jgi:hypothetical protein